MFKVFGTDMRKQDESGHKGLRVEKKFSCKIMRDQMFRMWDKNPYMKFVGTENPAKA